MSRRTAAGLLALGLIAVLVIFAAANPVGYVTLRPGPTLNVLGKYAGKQIVAVSGHPSYPDTGGLRMVTVYQSGPQEQIDLIGMLTAWADPDVALVPRDAVFHKNETEKQVQQESLAQMTGSQDNATAAALTALGIHYRAETFVPIDAVSKGSAADGKLQAGDLLFAVDGKSANTTSGFVDLVRGIKPGTALTLTVSRNGVRKQVSLTTQADPKDPTRSRIGVSLDQAGIKPTFPFKVEIRLSDNIGGPSAGMIFALSIYDLLTPGSLTDGKMVAGSGTISPDGTVGPIGGIGQKIPAAQRDGARLFLVAQENCAEAAQAHYDPNKIRLVKVHTLSDAIRAVRTWAADPNASLPGCS